MLIFCITNCDLNLSKNLSTKRNLEITACIIMSSLSRSVMQFLGIAIFCFILSRLDLEKVIYLISHLNLFYFVLANSLFFPLLVVKSIRWKSLMHALNINYSIVDTIIIYAASIFIGTVTPGNWGEFIKVFYLKEDGHPIGTSFSSAMLDKLLDLLLLTFLGFFGSVVFINFIPKSIIFFVSLIVATSIIMVILYNKRKFIIPVVSNFIPRRFKNMIGGNFKTLCNDVSTLNLNQIILPIILTFIAWAIYFGMIYILTFSLNIGISFLYLTICMTLSILMMFIPISIAGIGTRDATLIACFSWLGYSKESAVALSMMILLLYAANASIGLLAWLIKPLDLLAIRKAIERE